MFEDAAGKETPEYEAFEAALQMAVQDTRAVMLRLAKTFESDDGQDVKSDEKTGSVSGGQ